MKKILVDTLGWGSILWLIGYVLGIVLFALVPAQAIGWFITPVGIVMTLWVLNKKITARPFSGYLLIAIVWTLVAIALDYFFLVKLFKPEDGYYKLDVYFYYTTMLVLPLTVGYFKVNSRKLN